MTYSEFVESTMSDEPPGDVSPYLLALWHERRGDWDVSHQIIQDVDTKTASQIHAYLHRVEGDVWNADFWYRRAGMSRPAVDTTGEWEIIVKSLLNEND